MDLSAPAPSWPPEGPRPVNLKKDAPQLVELLELAFGDSLDNEGRRALSQMSPHSQPAFLRRFDPSLSRLAPGYVWQQHGRIVGNVTLLPTKLKGRHIVANVAVHPDFRRQGIARRLMQAVLKMVQARGGHVILLQVVKDNSPAIHLYHDLGFIIVGHMTGWLSSVSRLREIPAAVAEGDMTPRILPLRRQKWREAYQLDIASLHPDLNWPEPIAPDRYKGGLLRSLSNFINGRQRETWVAIDNHEQLAGIATIESEWGRAHTVTLRIHPRWRPLLERPLLAKITRRLRYLARRNIRIEHPDDDLLTNQLLREANFRAQRTLTHMRLDLE